MINYINYDRLVELFARIFHYGFINEFHPKAIEGRIINSQIVNFLETNKDYFLEEKNDDEIICDLYSLNKNHQIDMNFSNLSLWIANAYLNLFFEFKKSFAYLFLYISLEEMVDKFDLYHEMDVTQMFEYFANQIKEKTLLSNLLKEKKLTTKQLSVLSGISINTLNGYCKSDSILYGASYEYVSLISQILNVKPNIFLKKLYISLVSPALLTNKEKTQLAKDTYEFFNTKELVEKYEYSKDRNMLKGKHKNINIFLDYDEKYTYENIMQLISESMEAYQNKTIIYKNNVSDAPKEAILISNDMYIDGKKNKAIPFLVKEYAFIKADETPYSYSMDK